MIVVNYTTSFFDIHSLTGQQSPRAIMFLKTIFANFGIPKSVISDNNPESNASKFKIFAQEWHSYYDTSIVLNPQTNCLVERTIKTVKRTLKKAMRLNKDS